MPSDSPLPPLEQDEAALLAMWDEAAGGKKKRKKGSKTEGVIEKENDTENPTEVQKDFKIESKSDKKKKKKAAASANKKAASKPEATPKADQVDQIANAVSEIAIKPQKANETTEASEEKETQATNDDGQNAEVNNQVAESKSAKKRKKKAQKKEENNNQDEGVAENKTADDSEKTGNATDNNAKKTAGKKAAPKMTKAALILQRRRQEEEEKKRRDAENAVAEAERIRQLEIAEAERVKELERQKQERKVSEKARLAERKIQDEKTKNMEKQSRLKQGQTAVVKVEKVKNIEHDDTEIYSNEKLSQMTGLKINPKLRSPIVCVLGHVDTGKTKILDHLRCTKVQDNEAGGITQQIGSTNVSAINIQNQIKNTNFGKSKALALPGILLIDTPGHETFSNLRLRGSSMCDIAILVVDITHGLEPQTIESLAMLRKSKTPFIVALNKIDKLFGWQKQPDAEMLDSIAAQDKPTLSDFEERFSTIFAEFAAQGLNIALFYDTAALSQGSDMIPVVPTSAHSGEGLPDLLNLICMTCQSALRKKLVYKSEPEAIVMEAKRIQGYGMTLDIVLINGELCEGDTVVVVENFQPKVTKIKFILVPPTMAETRVKVALKNVPSVRGTKGIKITLQNSESADNLMIGFPLPVSKNPNEEEIAYMIDQLDFKKNLAGIGNLTSPGVHVQASTIGSLEALLAFLNSSKIAYSSVNIGDVFKKDVIKASTIIDTAPMYAVILAFDVKIDKEAHSVAREKGVKIFSANIIYHLYDQFTNYVIEYREKEKRDNFEAAIFPCTIKILPNFVFNIKDPLVCGVLVEEGEIRTSTVLRVFSEKSSESFDLGRIVSIEKEKKPIERAAAGEEVSIKVIKADGSQKMFGRHYGAEATVVSALTRESIDVLKQFFRTEMSKEHWLLVKKLKVKLGID